MVLVVIHVQGDVVEGLVGDVPVLESAHTQCWYLASPSTCLSSVCKHQEFSLQTQGACLQTAWKCLVGVGVKQLRPNLCQKLERALHEHLGIAQHVGAHVRAHVEFANVIAVLALAEGRAVSPPLAAVDLVDGGFFVRAMVEGRQLGGEEGGRAGRQKDRVTS